MDTLAERRGPRMDRVGPALEVLQFRCRVAPVAVGVPRAGIRSPVDGIDLGMAIEGLRNHATAFGRPVTFACEVVARGPDALERRRPLCGLKRDAIRAGEARRDEPDAPTLGRGGQSASPVARREPP